MTEALRTAPAQQRRQARPVDPYAAERQQFYASLGHADGAIEVVAGRANASDPNQIDLLVWTKDTYKSTEIPHTRKWFAPDDLAALDRHVARMAREHGNVYISLGTYAPVENKWKPGTMRHCRDVPLPRHCIVLDDVRDLARLRLRPTLATETSPSCYQVIYRCDQPLTPAEAQRLGAGAAQFEGCDPSGADATQIVRIPGTRNTKAKCGPDGWPVRLVVADGPTYTAEQLAQAYLPGGLAELRGHASGDTSAPRQRTSSASAGRDVGSGSEPWRKADYRSAIDEAAKPWFDLVRTGRGGLLADNGIPRGLKPEQPGYQILAAHQRNEITFTSPRGNWDASRERYHVIKSLMYVGYTDGQIAAMAERLADFGVEVKGTDAIRLDIHRLICIISAEMGDKRRVREPGTIPTSAALVERPQVPRATQGKGRPTSITPEQLLTWYAEQSIDGAHTATRRSDAHQLGISRATLDRHDRTLREAGAITIEPIERRRRRCVHVVGVIKNPPAEVLSPASEVLSRPALDPSVARSAQAATDMESTPAEGVSLPGVGGAATAAGESPGDNASGGGCALPGAEGAAGPALREAPLSMLRTAVRDGYDVIPRRYAARPNPRKKPENERAGELGRVTLKRMMLYLEREGFAVDELLVRDLMAEHRQRRKLEQLQAMPLNTLRAELRKAEAMIARLQKREQNPAYWRVYAGQVADEIRSRPEAPVTEQAKRKPTEAKPSPRATAAAYQAELLKVAEQAIERMRTERVPAARQADVTPNVTPHAGLDVTPAEVLEVNGVERPNTQGWRLIARLYDKQQREAQRVDAA